MSPLAEVAAQTQYLSLLIAHAGSEDSLLPALLERVSTHQRALSFLLPLGDVPFHVVPLRVGQLVKSTPDANSVGECLKTAVQDLSYTVLHTLSLPTPLHHGVEASLWELHRDIEKIAFYLRDKVL